MGGNRHRQGREREREREKWEREMERGEREETQRKCKKHSLVKMTSRVVMDGMDTERRRREK